MIVDLVNNVVTERERELKKKNEMLKMRIENLERSMAIEEAQRQERMQNMPYASILKNPKNHVKYQDQLDSEDSEDSEDEGEMDDDSEDSDTESDSIVA